MAGLYIMSRKQPRIRVCGLLLRDQALLMVKMQPPTRNHPIWMPPGGQLNYGESMENGVARELKEEAGLDVRVHHPVFLHQFLESPFHAIEFYFYCSEEKSGNSPAIVDPPENTAGNQVLLDVDFIPMNRLDQIEMEPRHLLRFSPDEIEKPGNQNLTPFSTF